MCCTVRCGYAWELWSTCAQIYPMMWQAYRSDTHLYFGPQRILCTTGFQQGDPLASLAFSQAIHPTITSTNSEFTGWYLDDGTFGGNLEQVSEDLQPLQQRLSQIDLQLNPRQSDVTVIEAPSLSSHNHVITRITVIIPAIVEVPFHPTSVLGSAYFLY